MNPQFGAQTASRTGVEARDLSRGCLMGVLRTAKDKTCLLSVVKEFIANCAVDARYPVLVVGGGEEDVEILTACGFRQIVLSNLGEETPFMLDAENIALPDENYHLVFAHAVLHHCRSPQKALGEMVRVSSRHVFFIEPNDSWMLRVLQRFGISFPYELAAVADNQYTHGGLRNGPIPNYIYRWTRRDVEKTVYAYHPERSFQIHAHAYWDFYVNEYELLARKESRIAGLAETLGARNLVRMLRLSQRVLNILPPMRIQGNKFACAISKGNLHPWIEARDNTYGMKRPESEFAASGAESFSQACEV